jgi:hypothetical protein
VKSKWSPFPFNPCASSLPIMSILMSIDEDDYWWVDEAVCFYIKWPYPFFSPYIELTFILCGLISVPVFLTSLSRSLQCFDFFVTQKPNNGHLRTNTRYTNKLFVHRKWCWLFLGKKKSPTKTQWIKEHKFGRAEREEFRLFLFLSFFCYLLCFSFPYSWRGLFI